MVNVYHLDMLEKNLTCIIILLPAAIKNCKVATRNLWTDGLPSERIHPTRMPTTKVRVIKSRVHFQGNKQSKTACTSGMDFVFPELTWVG